MESTEIVKTAASQALALVRRTRFEMLVLLLASATFLAFVPQSFGLDMALAAVFLVYVAFSGGMTLRIWGTPLVARATRLKLSSLIIGCITALGVFGFICWHLLLGTHAVPFAEMMKGFGVYLGWALLQQFIFQFYLLARIRAVLPKSSSLLHASLCGVMYGLTHFQDPILMLLTIFMGTIWSLSYIRHRVLIPIVLSHAILGTAYYSLIVGHDMFAAFMSLFV